MTDIDLSNVDFSDKEEKERTLAEWDRLIAARLIERLRTYEEKHGPVKPASAAIVARDRHTNAQHMPVIKALLIRNGWLKE